MFWHTTAAVAVLYSAAVTYASDNTTAHRKCRCVPSEPCWPSQSEWAALNTSTNGQLILDVPPAQPCYPGPSYNASQCALVDAQWTNASFQQESPVGYACPLFADCPPVNASAGQTPGSCSLGSAPVYTVNATCVAEVQAGIAFARMHHIRLVVRDTGHDLLGRSTGFGGLQIWIRYLRTGITFHEQFRQEGSKWEGSAFTIGGGYVWKDVYPEAASRGTIVVGGGTPSVGCLGGWMQGGGHSPATHDYGLGADQVLQAKVVLADGSVVTVSPSENTDLFFAIRGGGPGTYGIVVETTVKAWPTTSVVAQTLVFAPLTNANQSSFLDALADIYESYPSVSDAGWSGFGSWGVNSALPIFGNFSTGYAHSVANFRQSLNSSKHSFQPLIDKLAAKNGTALYVSVTYSEVPTYVEYYNAFSGVEPPAGSLSQLGSRFLDARHLKGNRSLLLDTLNVVAGEPGQYTINAVELLGGRTSRIAQDGNPTTASLPVSGLNPAWREMVLHHIVARGWADNTPQDVVQGINHDITYVKEAALKKLAPSTGCYMNEANRLNPDWQRDFYGKHYRQLLEVKGKYDRHHLFYCPTCVGSEYWEQTASGQLCRA
ncbi:FAD-binding domain-containing protein [Polychaeton citri CBS 116435]|uniref:FAD-binding domain-containing protein n=1 Tax=Polychaeton citri CBS 116435 TaxID=1314669 RepID=A0A9P4UQ84_9PEZI|nr:FAD-binding domain-containing protein [Polychaeton citri CBS 116435]